MQDEDFIWLLNTLKHASKDFETIYGIAFYIPDVIFLQGQQPSQWFYMKENKRIKNRPEDWLKPRVIKEYFNNPRITLEQIQDLDQQAETFNHTKPHQDDKQPLFYFYSNIRNVKPLTYRKGETPPSSIQVIRPATKVAVEEMFSKQENQEVMKSWSKIIGYYPINNTHNLGLYKVHYTKDFTTNKEKICVTRKVIERKTLMREEFIKSENTKFNLVLEEKQPYKSLATNVHAICLRFVNSLVRFVEMKFQERISTMDIEFFLTENGKIWLTGAEEIVFLDYNEDKMDKGSLKVPKVEKIVSYKCHGIYCECSSTNYFYDENDEAFSLFMTPPVENDEKYYYVQKKSIYIDVIERQKTLESIKKVYKNRISEQLLFKCRQYYSISELMQNKNFNHLKVDNFYQRVRVCNYCYNMYNKIDNIRIEQLEKQKLKRVTVPFIQNQIEKLSAQSGKLPGLMQDKDQKTKMSWKFYQKLQEFDVAKQNFEQNYELKSKVDDDYFVKRFIPFNKAVGNFFNMGAVSQTKKEGLSHNKIFQLPSIRVKILTDQQKMIKKKQLYVSKAETEALGLKHYLGHTKNLPFSDCGLAISKSSLALNHLQDKIQEVQILKQKLQNEKVKAVRQEIELMLCPYYGNGKKDVSRLVDFIDQLKEREPEQAEENKEASKIQVVTDKNEFLTENQRKQKQDKEQKEQEIQQTKKNFLLMNSRLAESIISSKNERKATLKPNEEVKNVNKNKFKIQQFTTQTANNENDSSDDSI